ncbi:muropeptide MFS transporter AmpG, partial [Nitrospinae bacterium]|nr:muropeptide MFS transporter AmpG [Nitrospinota bacterium]
PATMKEAVQGPFKEFFSRSGVWSLLGLIVLYKLGDAFAGSLTTTFLIRGVNFSVGEVGAINKGMGLASTIIGALFGGVLMARFRLFKSLLIFGIFQAISNLSFMILAMVGKNYPLMIFTIAFENLAGGMGTAAFVAFLMALCDHRFTATQFALLSALASLGRVFVGPVSGVLVDKFGWVSFFFSTFIFALPGLILLWVMKEVVIKIETVNTDIS